jgi:hypothetical protein
MILLVVLCSPEHTQQFSYVKRVKADEIDESQLKRIQEASRKRNQLKQQQQQQQQQQN